MTTTRDVPSVVVVVVVVIAVGTVVGRGCG